jgi:ABC-type uncharacterized transport system substrate-binding protein
VARAHQGERVRRIGVFSGPDENDPLTKTYVSAFTKALAGLGWTDGRNVQMDFRWADVDINRMRALAQELVSLEPAFILTTSTPATVAIRRLTRTIPIVFATLIDPVASGIVERLDRPSGNITGFATLEETLGGKWLELLSEIAPGLKRAAIMFKSRRSHSVPACAANAPGLYEDDKRIDHAHGITLIDPVIHAFRQQCRLIAIRPCDESLHQSSPQIARPHIPDSTFSRSQGQSRRRPHATRQPLLRKRT